MKKYLIFLIIAIGAIAGLFYYLNNRNSNNNTIVNINNSIISGNSNSINNSYSNSINNNTNTNNQQGSILTNTEIYTVNYTASSNTQNILNNDTNYEIVKSVNRLNKIMKNAKKNNYDNRFDNTFFNQMNLLVIQAGIDTEINEKDISKDSANITIYHAAPLSSPDDEFEYDLYLIPIEKTIDEPNIQISAYPDRLY